MTAQPHSHIQTSDFEGRPAGGSVSGVGLQITWQNGPLGSGEDRKDPNGCFVETVLAVAVERLEFYQDSPFRCRENALAITKIEEALHWLNSRTARRVAAGVEGTHEGN